MARKDKLKLRQQSILAAKQAAIQMNTPHAVQLANPTKRRPTTEHLNPLSKSSVDAYWDAVRRNSKRDGIKVICIPESAIWNVPSNIPLVSLVYTAADRFDKMLSLRYKHDGVCYMPLDTDIQHLHDFLAECIVAQVPVIAIHCTEGSVRSFNTLYGICYAYPEVFTPDFSYPDTNPQRYEERRMIRAISNGLEFITESKRSESERDAANVSI